MHIERSPMGEIELGLHPPNLMVTFELARALKTKPGRLGGTVRAQLADSAKVLLG